MQVSTQLEKDLKHIESDIKTLMKHVDGEGKRKFRAIREDISNASSEGSEQLREMVARLETQVSSLKDALVEQGHRVKETVEDNPWKSMAAALGVGLALGKFLDMKRFSV